MLAIAYSLSVPTNVAAADVPECYVEISASFTADGSTGSQAVDVFVLPDCSAIVGVPRALTPLELEEVGPQPAAIQQRCTWANRLIGLGGEGDILTAVNITQTFWYDYVNVTNASFNATTYNHWSTGWGVMSSWYQDLSSTPTPIHRVDAGASFSWYGPWHHDKATKSYAHGDGSCTGDFSHTGYVCSGCNVRFYIFYF